MDKDLLNTKSSNFQFFIVSNKITLNTNSKRTLIRYAYPSGKYHTVLSISQQLKGILSRKNVLKNLNGLRVRKLKK